jgi:hypothetical protein
MPIITQAMQSELVENQGRSRDPGEKKRGLQLNYGIDTRG